MCEVCKEVLCQNRASVSKHEILEMLVQFRPDQPILFCTLAGSSIAERKDVKRERLT
jgi:hypothetical protein